VGASDARAQSNAHSALTSELTVFRSPTCGCCHDWVNYMSAAGFSINDNITAEMDSVKQTYGVSEELSSCHTAVIDGYVIEGHVPAADVRRLLIEKPSVVGITAPGMPVGSPGMEMEMGDRVDDYIVYTFTAQGKALPFAQHLQGE
ncbi:MAG: DUF411 domain-containing protein, partial [Phormidesmis sp.]